MALHEETKVETSGFLVKHFFHERKPISPMIGAAFCRMFPSFQVRNRMEETGNNEAIQETLKETRGNHPPFMRPPQPLPF